LIVPLILISIWINHRFQLDSIRTIEDLGRATTKIRATLHPEDDFAGKLKSYLVFLLGAIALSTVGWPRWTICAVAGMVYGAFMGIVLSTIGTVVGSILSYFLGGSLLKSMVRRRFGDRLKDFDARIKRDGFGYILHLRLLPGSPGLVTNLLAGACRVRLSHYSLATLIGYVPKTMMFCLLASGAIKSNPWQLGTAVALYAAFSAAHYWWHRHRRAAQKASGSSDGEPSAPGNIP
jgi:uncharacterized membrane protein YdjX (TVP38/TMEM64 family)